MFEAINLFLAGFVSERRGTGRENAGDPGGSLRARFVIGLDPVVVAGHLDRVYADLYDPATALDGEDPSPGLGIPAQARPSARTRAAGLGRRDVPRDWPDHRR